MIFLKKDTVKTVFSDDNGIKLEINNRKSIKYVTYSKLFID